MQDKLLVKSRDKMPNFPSHICARYISIIRMIKEDYIRNPPKEIFNISFMSCGFRVVQRPKGVGARLMRGGNIEKNKLLL